ncbi:hypothetical protein BHM03_00035117 [Ensete ventricosum]|nr:hypothetical protein BHM03_00035117 [Ensete ventricosum]
MRPGIAGAVFGAGWWLWVNTVVCSVDAVVCCTSPVNPSPPSPSKSPWSLLCDSVAVGLLLIQDAPTDKAPYGGESMVICRVFAHGRRAHLVHPRGIHSWTSFSAASLALRVPRSDIRLDTLPTLV